ncbi:MAG: LysR family transcriptional regulator [Pseudomonadota bacterium]
MDITLIRTFLDVAATGSFVNASERLFVTQSAVSLRIQRLEDDLGKPLFTRSKAGAELTPAGVEFERYALSMLKLWTEARQHIALPAGFTASLAIGAQYSLWPRVGFDLIDGMRREMPGLSIRAELGMPDRLTRFLIEGLIEAALLYTPQIRPGLSVERVFDEDLILCAAWENATDWADHYVFVDWGPEFLQSHELAFPDQSNPGLTLSLGALAADYIADRKAAAYLPARYARPFLDAGRLHTVPEVPHFAYPVWSVIRDDLAPEIKAALERQLAALA